MSRRDADLIDPGKRRRWPGVVLLVDTLRGNVALGVPDDERDDAGVRHAISSAQLHGFVARLPAGLDSTLGERGARVPDGHQRIAIARAPCTEPSVLGFDEGTSALDNRTEAALIEAIGSLHLARWSDAGTP